MPDEETVVVDTPTGDDASWDATPVETVDATTTDTTTTVDTDAPTDTDTVDAAADQWAEFRDPTSGLIHGRYATPEEAVRAAGEADRAIAAKAYEAEQLRQQLEQSKPQPVGFDAMRDLAPLLKVPPSNLLANERFIRFGESKGIEWNTDEDGYVDMTDPMNAANVGYARELAKDEVGAAQTVFNQAEEASQRAEQQFFTAYPELVGWEDEVSKATDDLQRASQFGNDFKRNAALVAQKAKGMALTKAAGLMGKNGGLATAAKPVVSPVGGTSRGGGGGSVAVDDATW